MRRDLVAMGLLIAAILAFFWKIALTELVLAGLDSFTYFYPLWDYAAARLRRGEVPLWNPYLFLGAPFLANLQAGVLYPPNWIGLWLPAPKAVAYTLAGHISLAGLGTYLLARRVLRLTILGSWVAGALVSLGGYLGAQAEHVNQVSVLAWLPILLWLWHRAHRRRGLIDLVWVGVAVGLQALAGHAQASFITLVALSAYASYLAWEERGRHGGHILGELARLAGAILLGLGLAAAQLIPTWELAQHSLRGGGLTYRQAVSFSLPPTSLLVSLLPSLESSPFSEYIAYVGVVGSLLALIGLASRTSQARFYAVLAGMGLFLALGLYNPFYIALYSLIPGFSLFRVPARWLYLFGFGLAVLAGIGLDAWTRGQWRGWVEEIRARLRSNRRWLMMALVLVAALLLILAQKPAAPVLAFWVVTALVATMLTQLKTRWSRAALIGLMLGELFISSRYLAYDRATAPEVYSSLRSSTLHLLAAKGIDRVLSISDTRFDPGDLGDIQALYADRLSPQALLDFIVATKWKEVLAPNLALSYGLHSVDGYDGGLLPTARFVEFQRLLFSSGEPSLDGRLYQRLMELPRHRILSLLNVRYVLMDKARDVWIDGVYYDLGLRTVLDAQNSIAAVADVPGFPATAIALLSYLEGGDRLSGAAVVAHLEVITEKGQRFSYPIQLGRHTAGAGDGVAGVAQDPSRPGSILYRGVWRLDQPGLLREVRVRYIENQGQLIVRGMALLDERTGAHRSLLLSNQGRYRLVHSGDVKIYEDLDALPRAFIVHRARAMQSDEEILQSMLEGEHQPAQEVLLSGPARPLEGSALRDDRVELLAYEPERQVWEVETDRPAYLVLSDAYYPGWRALLDGQPTEIQRANLLFRAIYLPPGSHRVEFVYQPTSFLLGAAISLLTLIATTSAWLWTRRPRRGYREAV